MVLMLAGWDQYAQDHKRRYEASIGDDPYTGEAWHRIGEALQDLLTCELGRLNAGVLDEYLRARVTMEGFDGEQL